MENKPIAGAHPEPHYMTPHEIISLTDLYDNISSSPVETLSSAILLKKLQPYYFHTHEEKFNTIILQCRKVTFLEDWIFEYEQKLDRIVFLQSEACMFYEEVKAIDTIKGKNISDKTQIEQSGCNKQELLVIIKSCSIPSEHFLLGKTLETIISFPLNVFAKAIFACEKNLLPKAKLNNFTDYSPHIKRPPTMVERARPHTPNSNKQIEDNPIFNVQDTLSTQVQFESNDDNSYTCSTKKMKKKSIFPFQSYASSPCNANPIKNSINVSHKFLTVFTILTTVSTIEDLQKFVIIHKITTHEEKAKIAYVLSKNKILFLWQIGTVLCPKSQSMEARRQAAFRLKKDYEKNQYKNSYITALSNNSHFLLQEYHANSMGNEYLQCG